jgi:Na+-driven multidrug efflux pump
MSTAYPDDYSFCGACDLKRSKILIFAAGRCKIHILRILYYMCNRPFVKEQAWKILQTKRVLSAVLRSWRRRGNQQVVARVYKLPLYNMLGSSGTPPSRYLYQIYSLLLTIATAGIPIALSRLVSAALATGRRAQARRYYKVAMPAFILIGVICMVIMLLFARQMAAFMGVKEAEPGIRVLAPAVFFSCVVAVYRGYTQGFEDMTPTAVSQVIEVIFKMIRAGRRLHLCKARLDEATTTAGPFCARWWAWYFPSRP